VAISRHSEERKRREILNQIRIVSPEAGAFSPKLKTQNRLKHQDRVPGSSEWPEVVTEGKDIEECRTMLRDALNEMLLAYKQQRKEIS